MAPELPSFVSSLENEHTPGFRLDLLKVLLSNGGHDFSVVKALYGDCMGWGLLAFVSCRLAVLMGGCGVVRWEALGILVPKGGFFLSVGCLLPLSSIGVGVVVVGCWVVLLGVGCVLPLSSIGVGVVLLGVGCLLPLSSIGVDVVVVGCWVVLLDVGCLLPLSSIGVGVVVVGCWVVLLGVECVLPLSSIGVGVVVEGC